MNLKVLPVAVACRATTLAPMGGTSIWANAELLDIFAEVIAQNGPRDRRFRIEHAQHLRPQDYRRVAALGVLPSMQPYHAIDDCRWAEGRIGANRSLPMPTAPCWTLGPGWRSARTGRWRR